MSDTGTGLLREWIALELSGEHGRVCTEVSRFLLTMDARGVAQLREILIGSVEALALTWGDLESFSAAMIQADLGEDSP